MFCVVEVADERVSGNVIFVEEDDAENHFVKVVQENMGLSEEESREYIEEGYYQSEDGSYFAQIVSAIMK